MPRFNEIAETVQQAFPNVDLKLLHKAYVYSAKAHQGQIRLSGEPYLTHPLAVAGILADMRLDVVTVAAGLLHDAIEDTDAEEADIQREFGDELAFLVAGLTKISKIEFASQEERQAENFRKMLLAMSKDIRIILIKLADRLHNMRTLEHMTEDSRRRIAQETLGIYGPLAHRLGIYWMKQELEERAFKELYPELYGEIEANIREHRQERDQYVEKVIGHLSTILEEASIRAEVTGRVKDVHSIYKKMQAQQVDTDQIYDLMAFRIIVDGSTATCYETLGVVHGAWKPIPGRFKDYIAMPKPNGYQSLHTAVIGLFGERMEIQIRTPEMHRVAELGIAAHWKYKQDGTPKDEEERGFAWLRQLLEWQQQLEDPNEFLEAVRFDLFPDAVYVFTPQGDVIELRAGSTPIDFAYAVHTEIGNHCAGARVNGKLMPMRHRLANGDTVEIVTSPHQHPRQEWLEYVVTTRARNRIRHYLRVQQVEHARTLGTELLRKELQQRGKNFEQLRKAGELTRVSKELGHKGLEGLFAAVAYGKVHPRQVVRKLSPEDESRPAPGLIRRVLTPRRKASGVRVDGMDNVLVRFARCCNPLPGEGVVGYITRGRGVTVHTRDCPKSFHLDHERKVSVTWGGSPEEAWHVRIRVVSEDRPGLLAEISKRISSEGINIQGANIKTSDQNRAVQDFDLSLRDNDHLRSIVKQISKIRGVLSVERLRG
jgi:GTP pyrophosphokinase